jgi:hypothetical protein
VSCKNKIDSLEKIMLKRWWEKWIVKEQSERERDRYEEINKCVEFEMIWRV